MAGGQPGPSVMSAADYLRGGIVSPDAIVGLRELT